jgi:hypothetical protein
MPPNAANRQLIRCPVTFKLLYTTNSIDGSIKIVGLKMYAYIHYLMKLYNCRLNLHTHKIISLQYEAQKHKPKIKYGYENLFR